MTTTTCSTATTAAELRPGIQGTTLSMAGRGMTSSTVSRAMTCLLGMVIMTRSTAELGTIVYGDNDINSPWGGNDLLDGGSGVDLMWGGLGADVFDYNHVSDSPASARDWIMDFSKAQGDKADLSGIDAK